MTDFRKVTCGLDIVSWKPREIILYQFLGLVFNQNEIPNRLLSHLEVTEETLSKFKQLNIPLFEQTFL